MTRDAALTPLAARLDDLLACVHCGLCLPACPTYELLGNENDSPRGRLYLMRAVAEERLTPTDGAFSAHIDCCLGCRACEPVCPSGVRYGLLVEQARAVRGAAGGVLGRLARSAVDLIFGSRRLQNLIWTLLRLLRASGVPLLVARAGRAGRAPGRMRFAFAMLAATWPADTPELRPLRRLRRERPRPGDDPFCGPRDGETVALLEGCVMAGLYERVNRATEYVLHAHGARTTSLPKGLCCGALQAHAGAMDGARRAARRVIEAFEVSRARLLLTNSAGCGAALREYPDWLRDDPVFRRRAARFAAAVRDVSEWLADRPSPALRPLPLRVGYDAPCHLLHAQRIAEAPLTVLARIPDLEVQPLPRSERCCGAAGLYSLLHRRLSEDLLQRKLFEAGEIRVGRVVTGNPGCLMQIGAGAIVHRLPVRVIHPVELVAAALEAAGNGR
jgi:glycolate oxidase iron-sulfur subunit